MACPNRRADHDAGSVTEAAAVASLGVGAPGVLFHRVSGEQRVLRVNGGSAGVPCREAVAGVVPPDASPRAQRFRHLYASDTGDEHFVLNLRRTTFEGRNGPVVRVVV